MNFGATAKDDECKLWMTDTEFKKLQRHAITHRDDLVIQLGGCIDLSVFKIPQIELRHVRRTEDGEHYRLRVPQVQTVGSRGMRTFPGTWKAIFTGARTSRTLTGISRLWDYPRCRDRTTKRAAEATGDDDYRYVSSHNLCRRFAQRLVIKKQVNHRVVMQVGGCDHPSLVNESQDSSTITSLCKWRLRSIMIIF